MTKYRPYSNSLRLAFFYALLCTAPLVVLVSQAGSKGSNGSNEDKDEKQKKGDHDRGHGSVVPT